MKRLALLGLEAKGLESTRSQLELDYPNVETILEPADVSDESSIQNAINRVATDFERIDYGVNCAGIEGARFLTHKMPLENWQKAIDINQMGVLFCRCSSKNMLVQTSGIASSVRGPREGRRVIVNVSSMFGKVSPAIGHRLAFYISSKHDAMGYGPKGIRINAICPRSVTNHLLAAYEIVLSLTHWWIDSWTLLFLKMP
ncbi:uncharacterized protein N7443_004746 [Penicillium atrosanguineum]|uniref:uncharacterized protein n=1 Tax=Penicillium atrosanguineum TaxID=1132637 RepID=UPI00238E2108|nr:uncharacterized protein N7443_004746 [Penicillium atrosanguineum]KAJ5305086.1 hypothetical protein N7443_004746 [Penicillium atrosanguineum]